MYEDGALRTCLIKTSEGKAFFFLSPPQSGISSMQLLQFRLDLFFGGTDYVLQQVFTNGVGENLLFFLLVICVILVKNTLADSRILAGTNKLITDSRQRDLNSSTEGLFVTCVHHMLPKHILQLSFG